jgi:uncharacterized protein (DUF1499 family)
MIIWYAVLAVTAVIMVSIFARIDNWRRDWTTNFAKLDPSAREPDLRPLSLASSRHELADRINRWADKHDHWQLVSTEEKDQQTRIRLTRTTGLMRFVDDVQVRLIDDAAGTRVEAESQSRLGKGDLGQNPRNLKELLRGISDQ